MWGSVRNCVRGSNGLVRLWVLIERLLPALVVFVPAVAQADYVRVEGRAVAGAEDASIIFLNRCEGGLTVKSAWVDDANKNKSTILEADAVLPEYAFGDASWNEVVRRTRELFAPFDVIVTEEDPAPAIHYEAVVCGAGIDAGFRATYGVAPFSCEPFPNSINFTFPETIGNDPRVIAETVAQEVAHTFGLDHLLDCHDPMTYLDDCGPKSFQNARLDCGEYEPRECDCGGYTQNPHKYLIGAFGRQSDEDGPVVSIVAPVDGDLVEPGAELEISIEVEDAAGIASVALYSNGELASELFEEPWGPWPVRNIPEGEYEFYVVATDGLGNESLSESVVVRAGNEEDPGVGDEDEDQVADTAQPELDRGNAEMGADEGCGCVAGTGRTAYGTPAVLLLLLIARRRRRARAGARSRA